MLTVSRQRRRSCVRMARGRARAADVVWVGLDDRGVIGVRPPDSIKELHMHGGLRRAGLLACESQPQRRLSAAGLLHGDGAAYHFAGERIQLALARRELCRVTGALERWRQQIVDGIVVLRLQVGAERLAGRLW